MTMNNKELEKKVKQFTSELAYKKGYVCSVDVLLNLGFLTEADYQNWRFGRIPYLEKVCKVNLNKLSAVNKFIRKYSAEWNFEKTWTEYHQWGKGPNKRLIFSKSRDQQIETLYATHFLNKKRISELNMEKQINSSSSPDTETKKQETNSLLDEKGLSVTVVRDCGLRHCPPAKKFMRCRILELPLKPLLQTHFVMPFCFGFLM